MADPFVAEIRIFPYTFAPKGWAFCDGQLMPLSQNTALFALLGTTYGGNGKSNFALPNLQGAVPMHPGQGPGLSQHELGESGGTSTVTLLQSEIPAHSHSLNASIEDGTQGTLTPGAALGNTVGGQQYQATGSAVPTPMSPQAVATVGGTAPHNNMQPYLTFNFCIALQGVFPARS